MLYLLIALSAILVILFIVLFSKIKIFFEYKKLPGEKLYTDLRVSVGFININLKPKSKKEKNRNKSESDESIIKKFKVYKKTFSILKKIYSKNRWHIRKTLVAENIDFHIKFGLNDASSTGVAVGALWSALYALTALVSQVGTLKKHYYEVVPVYTEKGLILQGNAKLSVRVISAISLAVRLYVTYNKILKNDLTNK